MRRSDSVRFDPYFKVQYWDARSMAWVDVQIAYATSTEAMRAARSGAAPGSRWRIMMVDPGGRRPVLEGEV